MESHRDWRNPCYKVETSRSKWGKGKRYVFDDKTRELVPAEEYYAKKESEVPNIGKWNDEWAYLSTGKRMSKSELKQYCVQNGKTWIN